MQDIQTKSLWSQVLGEAVKGPMEGTELVLIPSQHLTFGEFAELYPDGVLLRKPSKGGEGSHYSGYFADRSRLGIFGRQNSYQRLDGKDKVVGLRLAEGPVAVSMSYLDKHKFALIGKESPVVVGLTKSGEGVAAYRLPLGVSADIVSVDDGVLTVVGDGEGKPVSWDLSTGHSPADGSVRLEQVPVITSFWFAWVSFFADTELVKL